jgi:phosphate transport system protein
VSALAAHDATRAAEVVKRDAEIDALERDLDVRAVRLLALRQPMARDLRQVLSALRIGTEFERISDFAKNIAKRSLAIGDAAPAALVEEILALAALAGRLLEQVVDAYRNRDATLAMTVWAQDERLDEAYTLAYHRIVFWMQEAQGRVPAGTHLMFIAKNIERIGDHATNVAESIHFQVTGAWLSEPRPKGDTTSSERIVAPG